MLPTRRFFERETAAQAAVRRAKVGGAGFTMGLVVGAVGHAMARRAAGRQSLLSGAFMGTIFATGALFKNW